MISKEHIQELAESHLANSGIFITGINVSADNHITVFIDGDAGVTIDDCVSLSRYIEKNLDRDKTDFMLDVSSHGATRPLSLKRQYPKHIGRTLEITLTSGEKTEGKLTDLKPDELTLEYETRENKPIGKGKITVTKKITIPFQQIKESKIKLKF